MFGFGRFELDLEGFRGFPGLRFTDSEFRVTCRVMGLGLGFRGLGFRVSMVIRPLIGVISTVVTV